MPSPARPVIGVDLGGTHVRVARVDPGGGIEASERAVTRRDGGPEAVVGQIAALAHTVGGDVPGLRAK